MKKAFLFCLFVSCAFILRAQSKDSISNLKPDTSKVWVRVDVVPEFPGGIEEFFHYLKKNLKYPKIARKNGVSGSVFVGFVVEKDGSLTNVTVVRGVSPKLDAEAVRLIKASPKWIPGSASGRVCRVSYTTPIAFPLDGMD